jgi:hypothetical protein
MMVVPGRSRPRKATLERLEVVWRVWRGETLSTQPDLFLWQEVGWRLADGRGLKQGCDALEDSVHADVGIHGSVDFVMVRASVHDQNLGSFVGLLDHIGQVMAIVLGQGGTEDDQIKGIAAQGFLDALAVEGGGHVMAGFGHFGRLGGECGFVALAIKNLDR